MAGPDRDRTRTKHTPDRKDEPENKETNKKKRKTSQILVFSLHVEVILWGVRLVT